MAYNPRVREHSRGSEKASQDKLKMGLRYAIEGASEIAVMRGHPGWRNLTLLCQKVLWQIEPLYDGAIRITPVSETKSFETLRKGLKYGIEAATEMGVLQERRMWTLIAMQLEKMLQTVDKLALAGRTGRMH